MANARPNGFMDFSYGIQCRSGEREKPKANDCDDHAGQQRRPETSRGISAGNARNIGNVGSQPRHPGIATQHQLLYITTGIGDDELMEGAVATHRFGGTWTERKLTALRDYLVQYQVIFTSNPAAQKLRTVYVDAFAGTGIRDTGIDKKTVSLFGYSDETREFQQGSARVALSLDDKFHHYVFIDSKAAHIEALRALEVIRK